VRNVELEDSAVCFAGDRLHDPPPAELAQSQGTADLRFKRRGCNTVFDTLYQSGNIRVRMPKPEPFATPEAIIINTAGGLAGGDEISITVRWQSGTSAALCSQAAEKVYRSTGADARVTHRLSVSEGASAEWLPHETIIFNNARLHRMCQVDVARGGCFLGIESVVFGRTAMGEDVNFAQVCDGWQIRLGGRLAYTDIFRIEGAVSTLLNRSAIGAGARAVGSILLVATGNLAFLVEQLRGVFSEAIGRAAASHWNGVLAARFLARNGETLKHDMALALAVLRAGRPLPHAWQC
jgi:urease accessory protein